jgi:hypothetical protein
MVSFALAMLLIPADVSTPSEHDLALGKNLAFIFPPLVAFWAGFVRRSLKWTMIGVSVGPSIGSIYNWVSGDSFDFFTVVIGLPCLLSGITAAAIGCGRGAWWEGILRRFAKGLLAGLVLAIVYDVVLSVVCTVLIQLYAQPAELSAPRPPIARFHLMMWIAGIVALGLAGAIYLPLFHWSANLDARRRARQGGVG